MYPGYSTHVVVRIKWAHEVVRSAQSKAPVYEELSLASFTNKYLGIVAEEKGSLMGEVMLTHLRALLQDMDVYGWKVVRDYHTFFSAAPRARPSHVDG